MPTTHFNTNLLPPREQFSYWNDAVCDAFTALECKRLGQGMSTIDHYRGSLERWDLETLQIAKVTCDPSHVNHSETQVAKSTEAVHLMHLQLAGESFNSQDGHEAILKPGDFTLCDSTRPYFLNFERPIEMFVLKIPHEILSGHFTRKDQLHGQRFAAADGNAFGNVINDYIKSIWQHRERGYTPSQLRSISECTLSLLSCHLDSYGMFGSVTEDTKRDSLYKTILLYIDRNLADLKLCPQSVARANNISSRNLRSLFAAHNTTCSNYIAEQRLKAAAYLLTERPFSHLKIIDIAFRCGFQDASHFSRRFKDYFGMSPKNYRRTSIIDT